MGTTWQLKVGLLALAYGTADANFLSTAKITGVELLFDAAHAPGTVFSFVSQSGFNYADPGAPASTVVPEPRSLAWCCLGLWASLAFAYIVAPRRLQTGNQLRTTVERMQRRPR